MVLLTRITQTGVKPSDAHDQPVPVARGVEGEGLVFAWTVRGLAGFAAVATEFFVHPEDPRFGVAQAIISSATFVAVVGGLWLLSRWHPR
jgi:hypothetical protein